MEAFRACCYDDRLDASPRVFRSVIVTAFWLMKFLVFFLGVSQVLPSVFFHFGFFPGRYLSSLPSFFLSRFSDGCELEGPL